MSRLYDFIRQFYQPNEFPALSAQISRWRSTRPLAGRKIYDATPVFRNTLVKYYALQCAGAEVTAAVGKNLPCDMDICRMLPEFGIRFADDAIRQESFDAVADCAGTSRTVNSRCGYVELTRSGLQYYNNWEQPVFSADSGVLKKLETILGTGEGFLRAMKQLGYNDFTGKSVVVFGCGKVGRGVAHYAASAGAAVTAVDLKEVTFPENIRFIKGDETAAVRNAIANAWCIVSVTGVAGSLAKWSCDLLNSSAVIANMGVEDEFGKDIPAARVLNHKRPLNFILEEPTHLKYIDATMALNNYGIEKLLSGTLPPGVNFPERSLEKLIARDIQNGGIIAAEMESIVSELQM